MKRLPWLTLLMALAVSLLMLLPEGVRESFYLNLSVSGFWQPWGLITGHFIHVGLEHYLWNLLAFVVLGVLIEQSSRQLLCLSLLVGICAIDVWLLLPGVELHRYAGLSGVLNTLMCVALYLRWQATRHPILLLIGVATLLKIILELIMGQSLITHTEWPPYAWSHLIGFLAAPLVLSMNVWCASGRSHAQQLRVSL